MFINKYLILKNLFGLKKNKTKKQKGIIIVETISNVLGKKSSILLKIDVNNISI